MKHLTLLFLLSTSLTTFSQSVPVENTVHPSISYAPPGYKVEIYEQPTPDTLRAICLVTLGYRNLNVAHARMGFVVVRQGKRPVYLDCRKRALKLPQVGWGYFETNQNVKLK